MNARRDVLRRGSHSALPGSPMSSAMAAKRFLATVSLAVASTSACDGALDIEPRANPVPVLTAVTPSLLIPTGSAVTVQISGAGFVEGATGAWNGSDRPTTLESSSRLSVEISANDLVSEGPASITVRNPEPGGGSSEPWDAAVGYPLPVIGSLSVDQADAVLTTDLSLTVLGSSFATGPRTATVLFGGVALPGTVVSSGELTASVPDYLLRRGSALEVRVVNPQPGGGASEALVFRTDNPVPSLSATSPQGVRVGLGGELRITGDGFVDGISVVYGAETLEPLSMSGTELRVSVPASLSLRGDTIPIQVVNPSPGGGLSNVLAAPVWERTPRVDALSTRWAYIDSSPFVLEIHGHDFAPDASLTWNGVDHAVAFVDSTRLDVPVDQQDLSVEGPADLLVTNPREGGAAEPTAIVVLPPFTLGNGLVLTEVWGGRELVISRMDGTQAQTFSMPDGAYRPDPSPSGDVIVFRRSLTYGFDRHSRLFALDPVSGTERRLLDSSVETALDEEVRPFFSGDGAWIYFSARESATGRWTAWRARPDGSEAGEVPGLDTLEGLNFPSPSNDGTRLVFRDWDGWLQILDLATLEITPLGVDGTRARWSPTDDRIAYVTYESRLFVIGTDGSDVSEPQPAAQFGVTFEWLPDGEHIIGTTPNGEAVLLRVDVGKVDSLPDLGQVGSIAWYANP